MVIVDVGRCGSRLRVDRGSGICVELAGARTSHVGEGRCWRHGGRSLRGPEHPRYTTGASSRYPVAAVAVRRPRRARRCGHELDAPHPTRQPDYCPPCRELRRRLRLVAAALGRRRLHDLAAEIRALLRAAPAEASR